MPAPANSLTDHVRRTLAERDSAPLRLNAAPDAAQTPATQPPRSEADILADYLTLRMCSCPHCRYDLTGVLQPTCPECGAALRLVLVARRSAREALSVRLWLMGMVGPCTSLGVLTLEAAQLVLTRWVGLMPRGGPGQWIFWNRILLVAGALLLVYSWAGLRESMARQHPLLAMILAQLAWILAVGLMAVNQYVFA